MGAVGYGPFDNDDAGDAAASVRNDIEKRLRAWVRRYPGHDERALAYVGMLIRLREGPSTVQFGVQMAEKIVANFNAPARLLRRIGTVTNPLDALGFGRNGDVWNDPARRLAVIRRTLRRWIKLGEHAPPVFLPDGSIQNPTKRRRLAPGSRLLRSARRTSA